jgi:hypothetical protein
MDRSPEALREESLWAAIEVAVVAFAFEQLAYVRSRSPKR